MIEFKYNWMHKDGTPIVRDEWITAYAEAVLADYRPELLEEPGKIDGVDFIENYLGANLEFQDIYYPEGGDAIVGAAIFNDTRVKVFDRDRLTTKWIVAETGSILIDNQTMEEGREGFALFTQMHEAGHLLMHQGVFKMTQPVAARAIACRQSGIGSRKWRLETQEDFREHQADTFAAALTMPREPFLKLAREVMKEYDLGVDTDGIIALNTYQRYTPSYPRRRLFRALSEAFGVSRTAAEVQLWKYGLIMDKDEYERKQRKLQMKVVEQGGRLQNMA